MKIEITLKDPDRFFDGVGEEVRASLVDSGLPEDEQSALLEVRTEKAWKALRKWVADQEYVTLVFDLDAMTATVKERR